MPIMSTFSAVSTRAYGQRSGTVFKGGDAVASDLITLGAFMKTGVATSPTSGGTLTVNGVSLGSYDYTIKKGSQTVSSFSSGDFFTATADTRSAFVVVDGDLTINSGQTFIPSVRKLFTFIYVSGSIVNNGTISMSARGANHSATPKENIRIANGVFGGVTNPEVPATGGAGGAGRTDNTGSGQGTTGITGTAGTAGGTGGGGSGGARRDNTNANSGAGASGTSFSGGAGSGGAMSTQSSGASTSAGGANGGAGSAGSAVGANANAAGGAGNPGGNGQANASFANAGGTGIGGVVIVYSPVSITGSGTFVASGVGGGNAGSVGGAGSGGGSVTVITPSSSGVTASASGGAGGTGGTGSGGAGGAGTSRILIA